MLIVDPNLNDMQRAMRGTLNAHWRLLLLQGAIVIILGVLAVCAPVAATLAIDIYVGILLLISGIIGLIVVFTVGDVPAFGWRLITALLSLAVGILLIWKPAAGALSLPLLLTAFFIVQGIFQSAISIACRELMPCVWGWLLASGITDLVLAAIIIAGWPITAAWTLGLLVGISLITSGIAIVMTAPAGRAMVRKVTG